MQEPANLKEFIGRLSGDNLFSAGLVGSVSMRQDHTDQLRKAFAIWSADKDNKEKKTELEKALLLAHAVSVITDEELDWCQDQLHKV
jgi:hypothetical protein